MFSASSHQIYISVTTQYRENESRPSDDFFVWSYQVLIENKGQEAVQLLTRRWEITDGNGLKQVVEGDGVIGEQPVIAPKQSYRYGSWLWLQSSNGLMQGHYGMVNAAGEPFDALIPAFSLDSPLALQMAN